jgi:hypothetical protein
MAVFQVVTMREHIDSRSRIAAHCYESGCQHSAWLDLHALERALGSHFPCRHKDLAPRLRCSACGSKNIGIRLHPDTRPKD